MTYMVFLLISLLLVKFLSESNCVLILLSLESMFLLLYMVMVFLEKSSYIYSVNLVSFLSIMVLGSVLGMASMVSMLRNSKESMIYSKSMLKY